MTRVVINGANGRMGQTLVACATRNPELELVGQVDIGDNLAEVVSKADAVVDFSSHEVTSDVAALCAEHGTALVIGTTGHSVAERDAVLHHRQTIPMVWASNFSTGVNALFWLTRKAAEILGADFDLEVVEMHHRMKKDAPSGTAKTLASILAEYRQEKSEDIVRHGREGLVGERTQQEIGVHSLRGGDVVGDHTVIFAGMGERVELSHKAASRETFANGALRAAQWAVAQSPGLYDMNDVLGLR